MLSSIVTVWILYQLNAPAWAFIIAWAGLVASFISFCVKLVELGKKS